MNDMINYLTTKNRLLVAMLAFILPFSFAKAEVKGDEKNSMSECRKVLGLKLNLDLITYFYK